MAKPILRPGGFPADGMWVLPAGREQGAADVQQERQVCDPRDCDPGHIQPVFCTVSQVGISQVSANPG